MDRLTGPDLPEDESEPPQTETTGLRQPPSRRPPTAVATDELPFESGPEASSHYYGRRLRTLGRAARALLACTLLIATLALPAPIYVRFLLVLPALLSGWAAVCAEGFERSSYRRWRWLRRRLQRRRQRRLARHSPELMSHA